MAESLTEALKLAKALLLTMGQLAPCPPSSPPLPRDDISTQRFDPGEMETAQECRRADGRQMVENIWKTACSLLRLWEDLALKIHHA